MPGVSIVVRGFVPSDQSQCRAIILEGLAEHFGFIDESRNPDLDNIARSYLIEGHDFYVAECDGEIVGTVGLLIEPACTRIVRMSVSRPHRKRGIATALLNHCVAITKERGLPEIVAFTEPHWTDAVGFYISSGFIPFGRDDEDVHLRLTLQGEKSEQSP